MPKTGPPFPPEFRREAVAMVRSGRQVPEVAESLGVSQQSLRKLRLSRPSWIAASTMMG
jgi:transposase